MVNRIDEFDVLDSRPQVLIPALKFSSTAACCWWQGWLITHGDLYDRRAIPGRSTPIELVSDLISDHRSRTSKGVLPDIVCLLLSEIERHADSG